MTTYVKEPKFCNYDSHKAGSIPSSTVVNAARQSFLYNINYAKEGQLLQFEGWPYAARNGEYASTFYVIFNSCEPAFSSGLRQFIIDGLCWNITNANTSAVISVNGVTVNTQKIQASQSQAVNERPQGIGFRYFLELDFDDSTFTSAQNGFGVFYVTVTNTLVHNLSVFAAPPTVSRFNADTGADYYMNDSTFSAGAPLIGADDPLTGTSSLGTLLQNQHGRRDGAGPAQESMISASRRCLFTWCHSIGMHILGGGAAAYEPVFKRAIPVRGRDLTNQTDTGANFLDIAIVLTADIGTKIRFESAETADFHEITIAALYATPTLVTVKTAMEYMADGDTIAITAYVSSTTAIQINTLTLWEQQRGEQI